MLNSLTAIVYGTGGDGDAHPEIVACILIAIIALICAIAPRFVWYIRYGWHFDNAEPSDNTLIVTRIVGIVVLVVLICALFPVW